MNQALSHFCRLLVAHEAFNETKHTENLVNKALKKQIPKEMRFFSQSAKIYVATTAKSEWDGRGRKV